ncbi:MAG: hypothetical protein ACYS8W_05070 [Planctomycetota bacterium]|jgi:hypothetical protein
MANILTEKYRNYAGIGQNRYALHVFVSEPLLAKTFLLAESEPDSPLYGLFLGQFEQHRSRNVITLSSSIVLNAGNWRDCIDTVFAEESFLEAFESNQLKCGSKQLLGWFAATNVTYPTVFETNTHKKFFKHPYQVLLMVDAARSRCRAFRFFDNRPVPVPIRMFRDCRKGRTFHTLKRKYGQITTVGLHGRAGICRSAKSGAAAKGFAGPDYNRKKMLVA